MSGSGQILKLPKARRLEVIAEGLGLLTERSYSAWVAGGA